MSETKNTRLDVTAMNEAITQLSQALEEFKGYDKSYLREMGEELDSFQSDFASKAQDLLKSMEDTVAPKMLDKMTKFRDGLKVVRDLLVNVDDASAKAMTKQ
ncbi:hypothetical protein [Anaerosacchariphilus polymeriproducens]|uniref:Uncharacterized protein n=1 Tax=Anaerosacchariphilus polymeriproducens TaxID=1812858 RepID=A0A371AYB4_9FIRM|nr:hypothetical protein [Anaerosacchariphilus polymeriproducens]RDU24556.1 hypothetical protein DWV06_03580 [Anaerosacchariphilus polymeriproducens]